MIEVKARILQRSVYIPEESIECELIVTNHGSDSKRKTTNDIKQTHNRHASDTRLYAPQVWNKNVTKEMKSTDDSVTLAWASAQVYCQCDINERRLKLPISYKNHAKQEQVERYTSFSPVMGETGHCLCSTAAHVLFCDLQLKKGESRKFLYSQMLPCDIPPSYKGQHIKLSYKVCIGIGRIDQPLCMIRLPFRLFGLKGIFKSLNERSLEQQQSQQQIQTEPSSSSTPVGEREFVLSTNPFLEENLQDKYSMLDAAMDALTTFTVKRNLNTYNIQSANGAVGKFCLSKHYYRLGEDVLGTFDFSESSISCVKYAVSLQMEETISKACLVQPSSSNLVHYITLNHYEECCYLSMKTNFLLPIPVTSTPEFTHKIVSVRWRLHFEFTIATAENPERQSTESQKDYNIIPLKLKSESMLWDLPIHVVATNPIQASLMMQAESSESVMLNNS